MTRAHRPPAAPRDAAPIDWEREYPHFNHANLSSRAGARRSRPGGAIAAILDDPAAFSAFAIRQPLRPYQLEPLLAIAASVVHHKGLEFLLIFPRQSGKNETVAHLLVYLLNRYRDCGGNVVYAAVGDQLGIGIDRLEARLDNDWNRTVWTAAARPTRRSLGRASVLFISAHPRAWARGHTAHHLLVVDEAQDHDAAHIERIFTPMRASTNATALYIGTVRTTADFLWQKKCQLERETACDGIRRVYLVTPDQVIAAVPAYRDFLDGQIRRHGRHHPVVASEYFLEPIDDIGGLFPPRRRHLMRGHHPRLFSPPPRSAEIYVATIDLAGADEAATDPIAALSHPGRDYTVATIFRVLFPDPQSPTSPLPHFPIYHALDVFVDHGSKHFEDHPGKPSLASRLLAWLQHWQVAHVVADESGVGAGLVSWLAAALGQAAPRTARVTGYNFSAPGKKAMLGALFISLIETGRFKYWSSEDETGCGAGSPGRPSSVVNRPSDAWWFWRQVEACTYELPPGGRFERDLRWGVPAAHQTLVDGQPQLTHDDRLLSAALVAELDRLLREGQLTLGVARSAIIPPRDPLAGLSF